MAKIPFADSPGILSVEVKLSYAADVYLVDIVNYKNYQNGEKFKYYGGHYTKSPVTITVSGAGRWFLIVDGSSQYSYRFY